MRDLNRIREQVVLSLGRTQIVWFTLGGVVAMGLIFTLGFLMGHRAARLEAPILSDMSSVKQLDEDKRRHDELTFYSKLTEKKVSQPVLPLKANPKVQPSQLRKAQPTQTTNTQNIVSEQRSTSSVLQRVHRLADTAVKPGQHVSGLNQGPADSGDYTVQVSAFQSLGEANAFSSGLERKGYKPYVVTAQLTGRGTWYRVRVGSFSNSADATEAKLHLARSDVAGWVLRSE
jgi:DedD protein